MKIITFYTDSHEKIYNDFFLNSYNLYLKDNHVLVAEKFTQNGDPNFGTFSFNKTCYNKVEFILDNLRDEEYILYSDCDVQFFGDLINDFGDSDILFQSDIKYLCAGFMFIKNSDKVKLFFNEIKKQMENNNFKKDDQHFINSIIRNQPIDFNTLPSNIYWTVGSVIKGSVWNGEDIEIPTDIRVHHANYTIGVDNKIKLLDLVRSRMKNR